MKKGLVLPLILWIIIIALPQVYAGENANAIKKFLLEGKDLGSVYLTEYPFKKLKKLPIEGHDVDLSPNGKQVAFTSLFKNKRTIKIFDCKTNNSIIFESLLGKTSYGAKWSPKGDKIIFSIFNIYEEGPGWKFAILNPQTKEWTILVSPEGKPYTGHQPSWAPDGESVLFHDLYNIYEVDISGELKRKISIKHELGKSPFSSVNTIQINKDRTRILFEATTGEWYSPLINMPIITSSWPYSFSQFAVFIYDIEAKTTTQISPNNMDACNPVFSPNEEKIIFFGQILSKRFLGFPWYAYPHGDSGIFWMLKDGSEIEFLIPTASRVFSFCAE